MGAEYRYRQGERILLTCYWGKVSFGEIAQLRRRRADDPLVRGAAAHVVDSSALHELEMPAADVEALAAQVATGADLVGSVPTAVVASSDLVYATARMIDILVSVQPSGARFAVFRTWPEAASWLGLDLGGVHACARLLRQGEI